MAVATGLLGTIHRGVCVTQESLYLVPVAGEDGHSDRSGYGNLLPADRPWPADGFEHAFRDRLDLGVAGDAGQQERELVSTDTGDCIALAHEGAELESKVSQQFVAGGVAERVVDQLEAVDVEEHHGEALGGAAGLGERHGQAVGEEGAVWEIGQSVVIGEVADHLFGLLALGDVAEAPNAADDLFVSAVRPAVKLKDPSVLEVDRA